MRALGPPPLTPQTLARTPVLGVLTLLDETLYVVRLALVAEYPTLDTADSARDVRGAGPPVRLAHHLLDRVQQLHRLLARYRAAVTDAHAPSSPPHEPDLDF